MKMRSIKIRSRYRWRLCWLLTLPLIYIIGYYGRKSTRSLFNSKFKSHTYPKFINDPGYYESTNLTQCSGPGENGKAHIVSSDKNQLVEAAMKEYGMNMVCSDEISVNRTLPDTRLDECRYWNYSQNLPQASVVIVFYNEGFSVLMRTVYSVINRTPKHLLREILLIDDYSTKQNLKTALDEYVKKFNGLVKVVRNQQRKGLIRTRRVGAFLSNGPVIVFLDAHCEVNVNWLPPLLSPINADNTIMTVPIIDSIDNRDFSYSSVYQKNEHFRGIFEWGLLYKETAVPKSELRRRHHHSEPYHSATHAGGLFAINRNYFVHLGTYDRELLVWGGENFELSFKIWMCGGSIEWVPCSRVGHVYRNQIPYSFDDLKKKGPLVTINYKRIVETWFDDTHKEYFYTREPLARQLDIGDINRQLKLKQKLRCKSFQWYMDNVAFDVYNKYLGLPPNLYWGELRSVALNMCLDTKGRRPPSDMYLTTCKNQYDNQLMRLNNMGQLGVGERCVDAKLQDIMLLECHLGTVDGPWQYKKNIKQLYHKKQKQCMAVDPLERQLMLADCIKNDSNQQWIFKEFNKI